MSPSEKSPSKYELWLQRLPRYARKTKEGNAIIHLKFNVNRAGFGFISHMNGAGVIDPENYPVMKTREAALALDHLWEQAVQYANTTQVSAERIQN